MIACQTLASEVPWLAPDTGDGGGLYWVPSLEPRLDVANVDLDLFVAHVGYAYRLVRHPIGLEISGKPQRRLRGVRWNQPAAGSLADSVDNR